MKRKEAKELLPVIQAFAEGKIIQCKTHNETEWFDIKKDERASFNTTLCDYRIKPEPEYRPFKDVEECWVEMQKHQPFGWLKNEVNNQYYYITALDDYGIVTTPFEETYYTKYISSMKQKFTFADGTPFGIKED